VDEQRPVVPRLGAEAGTDVCCLVQEDFTDQGWRGNAEVYRLPSAAEFSRMSVDRKNTDLSRSVSEEGRAAGPAHPFAQRQTHGNPRQTKTKGDVVVDALQLDLRRGPCKAERNVVFEGAAHCANASGSRSQVDDHEGIPRIGGKFSGKRPKLVLVVCTERPASLERMNRVHISRRACARMITRTRAREGKDPPLVGRSLILAFGHLGERPESDGVVFVDAEAAEAVAPPACDPATRPEGVAWGAVRLLARSEAVYFVFRRELAEPFAVSRFFGQRESGINGVDGLKVVG
jgi:hypothetical protein